MVEETVRRERARTVGKDSGPTGRLHTRGRCYGRAPSTDVEAGDVTKLRDIVDQPAVLVEEHEPIARAASRMYEHHVGSVLVTDPEGALGGIFTERDLVRACASGVDTHAATVGRWMTASPVVAHATDEAGAALQLMIDRDFRHLPVLGQEGILGVVSMRQLSRDLQSARMG
jgi:signal-transduction protein with cAMP-binding, CBS, and nucleotidyltransferase domain